MSSRWAGLGLHLGRHNSPLTGPSATALQLFISFSEEAVFLLHQDQPLLVDFRDHHLSTRPQQPLKSGLPRSTDKAAFLAPTTAASISSCPHSVVSLHRELQSLGGLQRLGSGDMHGSWLCPEQLGELIRRSSTSVSLSFLLCTMGIIICPT